MKCWRNFRMNAAAPNRAARTRSAVTAAASGARFAPATQSQLRTSPSLSSLADIAS